MVSATGLGSGLDISGLVTQLVSAERATSDLQISRETSKVNTKLSALGSFKGALSAFESTVSSLSTTNFFGRKSATSSDANAVSATAGDKAVPNTYALNVTQLADVHALASGTFAAKDSAIGTGTLTFRFGTTTYNDLTDVYGGFTLNPDSKVTTLTIDSSNNTLEGIMAEINEANFGVRASIVNAGDGYKLLLSSNETGLKNSLEITTSDGDANNTDAGATAGLSNFAFNSAATNMQQTNAAKNANYSINGLSVSSASNVVKDAIDGVDLTLKTVTTSAVTLTVKKDNAAGIATVQNTLNAYNSFIKTVNSLTSYNATTKKGGALMGDFSVRSIKSQIDGVLRNVIEGVTGDYRSLAEIGVKTLSDGTYSLDTAKLTNVMNTAADKLPPLFIATGTGTDSNVTYSKSSDATTVGNYAVNVTTLATSGSFQGGGVLPTFTPGDYLTIDADNNSFNIAVDGVETGTISLTTGEYQTGASLAEEIEARINGAATLVNAGVSVSVAYNSTDNRFEITSASAGSLSTVNMKSVGTNVAADLGFTVVDGTAGTNVAGSIGGVAATGLGDVLKAATGSPAEGLEVKIGGTTTGARGTFNFTRGALSQLSLYLGKMLDESGSIETRIDALKDRLESVEDTKARQELRWESVRLRYLKQFNTLDSLISNLNSTGSFLTQQLANLPGVGGDN